MRSLSLRSGNSPTTPYGGRVNGVGSRTGAPPVGSSESGPTGHVSSPRLVKRSMRISRTTLSCLLRVKGYVAVRVGSAFRAAHSSRVLLHLFQPCPQCFRWVQPSPSRISSVSGPAVHRRLYHLASASLVAKVISGPYLFFRSPEPLPGEPILRPLAGLYKTRNSHLAGNRLSAHQLRDQGSAAGNDRTGSLQTAGPLPSTGVTRLPWYYQPLRHPLACQPTSRCSRLYGLPLLRRFLNGARRASPVA